ncbi:DUF4139 domain-containing protein [Candidatus Micrarchaeota archaeon]|nr:DUF4139 domain-containing protein [Candidatus Micrarchaeota archaeon]
MKKQTNLMIPLAVVAIIAIVVAGAVAFHWISQQPTPNESTVKVNWDFLQNAVPSSSDKPSAVEVTVYQSSSSQSYGSYANQWLNFDYYTGMGLVKEVRSADVAGGASLLSLKNTAGYIDATSVTFKDLTNPGTELLEQNYDYDLVSDQKLLEKYVDKTISVKTDNETITGTLLSSSGGTLVLQTASGIVSLTNYKQISYPSLPEGLITTPTLTWLLANTTAGRHDFEVTYLTSGIDWSANYVATSNADDTQMELRGWVSVTNDAGTTFENAQLKLVAGDIHLVSGEAVPSPRMYDTMAVGAAESKSFAQEQLFEYHLYTLERPTTLKNGQVKQINFFNAPGVPVEKQFVFEPDQSSKVQVKLNFENRKDKGLGLPLPKGKVRVYKPDSSGQLQFLGEDQIDHTAENESLKLFIGNAFDVVAERTQTNYVQHGSCASETSYTVQLRNHKTEPVSVVIVENTYGDTTITHENMPHKKESAYKYSWTVPVSAGGTTDVTYSIEQRWC